MKCEFLDLNQWEDILSHIKKHKVRTGLTAFGVFWGIFLLLVLLGAGNGIEKGVFLQFGRMAVNSIHVWGGRTSMPYKGQKPGRWIQLTNEDAELIRNSLGGLEAVCPRLNLWGSNKVKRGRKNGAFTIQGEIPEIYTIEPLTITQGRFINQRDILTNRKVTVIGKRIVEILYSKEENPVGSYLEIEGVPFLVVGVYDYESLGGDQRDRTETLIMPLSTMQRTYNRINQVGWFSILLSPEANGIEKEDQVKSLLAEHHSVHPEDQRALGSYNSSREYNSLKGLFSGIRVFLWVVGLGTLLAGMIGVSNIMLIIVQERTKEIGIRKTLGATPVSIVTMILQEAFLITAVSGYSGVVSAVFILEAVSFLMKKFHIQSEYFSDPEIGLGIALSAMVILVLSGLSAGFFPALKAARIHPVQALREE